MAESSDVLALDETFLDATQYVKQIVSQLSEEQLLEFYGLFKQATEGPCNRPKPSWYQMTEKQKWQAWTDLKEMDKCTAKKQYVDLLNTIDEEWVLKKKDEEDATQSWVCHSSLPDNDEFISDSNKTLFDWVKENNVEMLKNGIEKCNKDVNLRDVDGLSLLHWAADRGHLDIAKYLVSLKIDINGKDSSGQTALHYASCCSHGEVVKYLLQNGADVHLKDEDGETAYELADCQDVKNIFDQFI